MPGGLNYTHEGYLKLFFISGECNKVLLRTCQISAARYPDKHKLSLNELSKIFKIMATLKQK